MKKDREKKQLHNLISLDMIRSFWFTYSKRHEVKNNRERQNIVHKHAFFVIVRENTALSLASIGSVMGKDHATVLHACRNHESNYRYDPDYRLIHDNMLVEIEDYLMVNGVVPKPLYDKGEVKDIHFRFLDVSRRLRNTLTEFEMFKKSVEVDLKRIESTKKYNFELQNRIYRLEKELKRVKNLI